MTTTRPLQPMLGTSHQDQTHNQDPRMLGAFGRTEDFAYPLAELHQLEGGDVGFVLGQVSQGVFSKRDAGQETSDHRAFGARGPPVAANPPTVVWNNVYNPGGGEPQLNLLRELSFQNSMLRV